MIFENGNVRDGFMHHFNTEENICNIKAVGNISISESLEALNKVMNHPEFHENLRFNVDLTEIRFNPSYNEIESIKNRLIKQKERLKNKIALVSVGSVSILVYLIAQYAKHNGLIIKSFTTFEKANDWINDTEDSVTQQ
ncbi:hypothetical protein ACE01N_06315 [Saccharicrinis sp. FJH2]|uniref:hypothetical protein n=1 Tax=Saccharicrinis sp. FJH65 TaxID=3344659 RepID=UPI0035F3B3FC